MAKTNYFEDRILNYFLRNDPEEISPPAAVYAALLTAVSNAETGSVTEVSGGGYARQEVIFTDPAGGGETENDTAITFPQAASDLGTVTHFAIYDAVSSGNALYIGELDAPFSYATNVEPTFDAGSLTITED